jgi:hypothetical protein
MGCGETNPNPNAAAIAAAQSGGVGNTPRNVVGPYQKTIDTIPPGESRALFALVVGANPQQIFSNPKSDPVEVAEVFFQSVGGNTVTVFINGSQITPAIQLLTTQGYTDSGFILPTNSAVFLLVAGAGTVGGFVRWRYQ